MRRINKPQQLPSQIKFKRKARKYRYFVRFKYEPDIIQTFLSDHLKVFILCFINLPETLETFAPGKYEPAFSNECFRSQISVSSKNRAQDEKMKSTFKLTT